MSLKLKRFSFLLICLQVALVSFGYSFSNKNDDGKMIYYNITSSSARTVSVTYLNSNVASNGNAYEGFVKIPSVVVNNNVTYNVTGIDNSTFSNCSALTSIEVPASVTSIGNYAFNGCSKLATVVLADSDTQLSLGYKTYTSGGTGYGLFYDCPLDSVYIGRNLSYSSGAAYGYSPFAKNSKLRAVTCGPKMTLFYSTDFFTNCYGLKSVTLSEAMTSINNYTFNSCSGLTKITIPNSVTTIGTYAFSGCSNLATVEFSNKLTSIGSNAFNGCWKLSTFELPQSLVTISDNAFYNCQAITKLHIPNSVTSIGSRAFYTCVGLNDVQLGSKVKTIGTYAFYGCTGLKSIDIPSSVTSIGSYAFQSCSLLSNIKLGASIATIGDYTFNNCSSLTSIEVPASVTTIGNYAFNGCSKLSTVVLADSDTQLSLGYHTGYSSTSSTGNGLFYDCPLDSVYVGRNLSYSTGKNYGYSPFAKNSKLRAVTCGPKMTLFYSTDFFTNCYGLKSVTLSEAMTSINNYTFNSCSGLTKITIPNSVTTIGTYAFSGCSNLATVEFSNKLTSIGSNAFNGCWKLSTFELPQSLVTISDNAFYNCQAITKLHIPNSVTSIGSRAFYTCVGLNDVQLGSKVKTIGTYAFYGCTGLKSIDIPSSVTSIGSYAFQSCSLLSNIKLGASIATIGDYTFNNCSSLTSIEVPASVTTIGNYAFNGCSKLSTVVLADSDTQLSLGYKTYTSGGTGYGLFYDCPLNSVYIGRNLSYSTGAAYGYSPFAKKSSITNIAVGDKATIIPSYLFYNCSSISNIKFGNQIKSIQTYAFYGCPKISKVCFPESLTSIGTYAFASSTILKDVSLMALNPFAINENVFSSNTYSGNLYVPITSLDKYLSASVWNKFSKIDGLSEPTYDFSSDGIFYIITDLANLECKVTCKDAYYQSYMQESITLSPTVEYNGRTFKVIGIDDHAFDGSILLKELFIPESIVTIGSDAFINSPLLKSLQIPNTISINQSNLAAIPIENLNFIGLGDSIPNWFKECKTLKTVEFNCPNITTIADSAFFNCAQLHTINLPNSISEIGKYAFSGCRALLMFDLPHTLSMIEEGTFKDCSNLKNIDLTDNIESINEDAYENCTSVTSLTIPSSVHNISNNAFKGCNAIRELIIKESSDSLLLGVNNEADNTIHGIFSSALLKEVFIGRNLIASHPFDLNKAIESLSIGHYVTEFPDLSLTKLPQLNTLFLGNRLDSIPSFSECVELREITIGSHILNLPSFKQCLKLDKITLKSAMPQPIIEDFSNNVYLDCQVNVPVGTLDFYKQADIWKNFFNIKEYQASNKAISLKFSSDQYDMYPEENLRLWPNVYPVDASEVFHWSSSNEDVASIDVYGNVTAKALGQSTITVTTTDGSNISASCIVKVNQVQQISNLIFIEDYYALTVGEQVSLDILIEPNDATYKNLLWSSSDETIATVSNGTVISHTVGKVTITAESTDGSNVAAYCIVEVLPVYITDIDLISTSNIIVQKDKMQLDVVITPDNASIKSLNWEVSDTTIATISDNGLLEAVLPGKCTVYAYATDGSSLFASQEFEVLPIVASTITADINQTSGLIDLKWNALEYVRDVKDFNVYVSENDSDFVLWLHNTTQTTAQFKGKEGGNYRFLVTMRNKNNDTEKYDESKCIYINNISK